MSISDGNGQAATHAVDVRMAGDLLRIGLDDGRELHVLVDKVPWLKWLSNARPDQKEHWSIEPNGYAVYWEDLDDGVEISHLLEMAAANNPSIELSAPLLRRFDPHLVGSGEAPLPPAIAARTREAERE
ncbi:DUF2442 domain-containing protein [Candidatus Amarolinea aalborgensis]|jgi:hypothetical protein|uniref:DUF2442 domain-containing protein n=1 Tax=Candidatus Amarolinea aalborgensis TaxID=2249329 RepID=UPI003BF966BE